MYVMDCVSWFLGCRVVAWIVICGLMYVMDCVSGFLLCCCMDCDIVCMMYVMDCSSWFLESLLWVLLHGLLSSGSDSATKGWKRNNKTNKKFCFDPCNLFTQNKTGFSVNKN